MLCFDKGIWPEDNWRVVFHVMLEMAQVGVGPVEHTK
jgi:hypothetical protein